MMAIGALMPLLARLPVGRPVEDLVSAHAEDLATAAARHGVSAWVADGLAKRKLNLGSAQRRLLGDAHRVIGNTAKVRRLLFAVLEAASKLGITPIVLKGYGLGIRLYENPLGRPSADVDVLVRRDELTPVGQALEALGLSRFIDDSLSDVIAQHHHLAYTGKGGLVEVHFKLMSGLGIDSDDEGVFARRIEGAIEGRRVYFLSPEDEFVYLAAHAANHAFLRVSWLVDLQVYLTKYTLDWALMREVAKRWGCIAGVSAALLTLERSLEVRLPDAAHKAFLFGHWRSAGNAMLFSSERLSSAKFAASPLSSFVIRLWLVDSPGHVVRYLASGAARNFRRRFARGFS